MLHQCLAPWMGAFGGKGIYGVPRELTNMPSQPAPFESMIFLQGTTVNQYPSRHCWCLKHNPPKANGRLFWHFCDRERLKGCERLIHTLGEGPSVFRVGSHFQTSNVCWLRPVGPWGLCMGQQRARPAQKECLKTAWSHGCAMCQFQLTFRPRAGFMSPPLLQEKIAYNRLTLRPYYSGREEILHHLGWRRKFVNSVIITISTGEGRISSINSMDVFLNKTIGFRVWDSFNRHTDIYIYIYYI